MTDRDPRDGDAVKFLNDAIAEAASVLPAPPSVSQYWGQEPRHVAQRLRTRMDTDEFRAAVTEALALAVAAYREDVTAEYRKAAASAEAMAERIDGGEVFRERLVQ